MTEPGWQAFAPDIRQRLFDAVQIDDVVDERVVLPDPIVLDCSEDEIKGCFALSLQFWEDGFTRSDLLRLVRKLLCKGRLDADESLQYKDIRARYKHLRFAQRLYGNPHVANERFDRTTRVLGFLQDAFRSGQRVAVFRYSVTLRLLLANGRWTKIQHAMEQTQLDTPQGFLAHRQAEMRRLKKIVALPTFTGEEFHTVRKIVSQQLSHYDTLRSLAPNEHAYKMSRFLAAINGLMGARHDEMVADSLAGRRDYDTPVPLSADIRQRLETLVANYPLDAI